MAGLGCHVQGPGLRGAVEVEFHYGPLVAISVISHCSHLRSHLMPLGRLLLRKYSSKQVRSTQDLQVQLQAVRLARPQGCGWWTCKLYVWFARLFDKLNHIRNQGMVLRERFHHLAYPASKNKFSPGLPHS